MRKLNYFEGDRPDWTPAANPFRALLIIAACVVVPNTVVTFALIIELWNLGGPGPATGVAAVIVLLWGVPPSLLGIVLCFIAKTRPERWDCGAWMTLFGLDLSLLALHVLQIRGFLL
jgi:hypothetical protein